MRRFQYVEPSAHDGITPVTITVSFEWILKMYYPFWWEQMLKAGRVPQNYTMNDVVTDFCVVNWATEI